MNTLLVIDMQNAWLNVATRRFDRAGVISRINTAAERIRSQGGSVVFVRHVGGDVLAGTEGWEVDAGITTAAGDAFVDKRACDAFSGTGLLDLLNASGTRTLHICGLATEFCVDTTLRAAVSHGFDVVALADAHTTSDRAHMDAQQIIAHHNWVWSNLIIPDGQTLRVQAFEEVLS